MLGIRDGGLDGGVVWVNPIGFTHTAYTKKERKLTITKVLVSCHHPGRVGSPVVIINTS